MKRFLAILLTIALSISMFPMNSYASWELHDPIEYRTIYKTKTYKLAFHANGGTIKGKKQIKANSTQKKVEYEQEVWYNEDGTLDCIWRTEWMDDISDAKVILPKEKPKRKGYIFKGWYYLTGGVLIYKAKNAEVEEIDDKKTVFALWKKRGEISNKTKVNSESVKLAKRIFKDSNMYTVQLAKKIFSGVKPAIQKKYKWVKRVWKYDDKSGGYRWFPAHREVYKTIYIWTATNGKKFKVVE